MEFQETQAIYQQVADYICEMILLGKWAEEERIPSVRELAMEFQVNPNTVNKSYSYLQDRNIIYNQRGIGYFVSNGARELTNELKRKEFVKNDLPHLFRSMAILGISLAEVKQEFERFHRDEKEKQA